MVNIRRHGGPVSTTTSRSSPHGVLPQHQPRPSSATARRSFSFRKLRRLLIALLGVFFLYKIIVPSFHDSALPTLKTTTQKQLLRSDVLLKTRAEAAAIAKMEKLIGGLSKKKAVVVGGKDSRSNQLVREGDLKLPRKPMGRIQQQRSEEEEVIQQRSAAAAAAAGTHDDAGLPEDKNHNHAEQDQEQDDTTNIKDQNNNEEEEENEHDEGKDEESKLGDDVPAKEANIRVDPKKGKLTTKYSTPTKKDVKEVLTKHGSGPARAGYVVDLVEERQKASFRNMDLPDAEHFKQRAAHIVRELKLASRTNVKPCEYIQGRKLLQHANCRDPDILLAAYNDAPFTRYHCGREIPPFTALKSEHSDKCDGDVVRLFPFERDPPVDGEDTPAVVVLRQGSPDDAAVKNVKCDIPCQFDSTLLQAKKSGLTKMVVLGTDWTIVQTNDDPYYSSEAKIERTNYRRNMYYSTTSFLSSVPLSFYDFEKFNLRETTPITWSTAGNKATYILDKDCQAGRRHKWIAAVGAVMDIEAYGLCQHNTDLEKGESIKTMEGRRALMKKNRITLAFEAGNEKDYITEIVWEALLAGSVPAILGANNLEQRLPPGAAIYASNFNSWDKFAAYIKKVSEDQMLWESFHEWRSDEKALAQFEEMFYFTKTSSDCRICRWAYAKQYGLGWDHAEQAARANHLSRRLCFGKSSSGNEFVTKPFRELWFEQGFEINRGEESDESCTSSSSKSKIKTDNYSFDRKIVQHDGVIDVIIQRIEQTVSQEIVVLRLEIDGLRNTDGAYFRDTHTLVTEAIRTPAVSSAAIQDDKAKFTVLANWETIISSPEEGVIEIIVASGSVDQDEIRRIRVITEDIHPVHDKMTEYFPSTFCRRMTQDFIDPLELYYAV